MSSVEERLHLISGQVSRDQANKENTSAKVTCTIHEHSPGHNVARITFSNPTKLNVASNALLDQLIQICEGLCRDQALRAIIFTGAPPSFSEETPAFIGGADPEESHKLTSTNEARKCMIRVHNACAAVQSVPVPVIARVHGVALGVGLELMSACDLIITTRVSKFGMPQVKIGLPSIVEAALLSRSIGVRRTRRLVYSGENISARLAEEWGLVEQVVDNEDELDRAVDDCVGMVIKMGPEYVLSQKTLARK